MSVPRTAIITGASSGVGAATALMLAEAGMDVALVARRRERLDQLVEQIQSIDRRAFAVPADLQLALTAEIAMNEAIDALGSADVLVNCLGTNVPHRALRELTVEDWDLLVATNLSAVFYCLHAVLPRMRAAGSGLIITISSVAALHASGLSGAGYTAAKAGVSMLSRYVNLEEGENGIRACLIDPGDINTELLDRRPQPPSAEHRARILQPEDIARLVLTVIQQPRHVLLDELVVRPS